MASLFQGVSRQLRPAAFSFFGLFTSSTLTRPSSSSSAARCSRFLVRGASEFAPRECPTPLVLLRAKGLSGLADEAEDYYAWGGMFSERGYTAVEIDIEAPTESNSSSESLQVMAKELSQQIRLMAIPFPPVIISTGPSTLLSQTFISDFPASALVMINPPSNESSLLQPTSGVDSESIDAAPKAGFTYEPHFPIYILSTGDKADDVAQHRLVRLHADKGVGRAMRGVTYEQAEGGKAERSEGTRMMVERWLDRCGY